MGGVASAITLPVTANRAAAIESHSQPAARPVNAGEAIVL
jgi:hypothetical protein